MLLPISSDGVGGDGRGETLYALRSDLGGKLAGQAMPTPEDVDRHFERQTRFNGEAEEDPRADTIVERGQIFPVGQTADGRTTWAVPQILRDVYDAVTLPGDVWAGRVDPQSKEGFARTMNLAEMIAGSGALGRAAQRHIPGSTSGNVRASRSAGLYNPRKKPPRPFEADYPDRNTLGGAQADEAGKLATDIEGRPLGAEYVAGRRLVGGDDKALSPAEIRSIGEKVTGGRVTQETSRKPGGDAGRYYENRDRRSGAVLSRSIEVDGALPADKAGRVLAHEVSHAIDSISRKMPVKGLDDELRLIYNDLNNPQSHGKWFGPEQHLYRGDHVRNELVAEAIRAYMADPNYMKTVAPKTAAVIRKFVNDNPKLKRIIQFNTVAGAVGLLTEDDDKP